MKNFLRLYWPKLLLFLALFAVALRIGNLFSALDYDEIWTMTYFSSKGVKAIFTELSLPNNQVLNSLCVKGALALGVPVWGIRLHSLIAGVLAVMLMVPIGIRMGKTRGAGFWSAVFLLCSAPAAIYSQLARGYELQLFFLLLYTWGILYVPLKKFRYLALGAVAAGGLGAVLTLPTSVIYLGCITCAAFIQRPKLPEKELLILLAAGVVFCGLWYGINFHQFREGQQFGTEIHSMRELLSFSFKTLDSLIPLLWCPFIALGLALLPKRRSGAAAGIIAAVLLSALATRGGPERVYIPLAACAALLAGAGADRLCRKLSSVKTLYGVAAAGAVILCAAGGFCANTAHWTPADWYALFAKGESYDKNTLVIYSGTNGFPVMWNNQPRSLEDNANRISGGILEKMVSFTSDSVLNGVDEKFNEQTLPLKNKGLAVDAGFLYGLELISVPADGDEVILVISQEEKVVVNQILAAIMPTGRFLRLNIFFEDNSATEKHSSIRGGIVDKSSLFDWKKLPESMKLYRIKTVKE